MGLLCKLVCEDSMQLLGCFILEVMGGLLAVEAIDVEEVVILGE